MTLKLDKSQKAFLDAFETNTTTFNNDFLILTGDAGTGKTELVLEMIKIAEKNQFIVKPLH